MIKNIILPIVFVALAGGIYLGFTDTLINGGDSIFFGNNKTSIVELRAEKIALEQALSDARKLEETAANLRNVIAGLDQNKIARLDDFLPDSVDNLQLIVDINNIAGRSNMTLGEVVLADSNPKNVTPSSVGAVPAVETTKITFNVTGSYSELKSFLRDLSNSLRLINVSRLEFDTKDSETGEYTYKVDVETYWLK